MSDVTLLIPSYEPEEKLIGFVDELVACGFGRIVIVDDGSSEAYRKIFDRLRSRSFCTVLRHDVNRGKGASLKTGYAYIYEHLRDSLGVVTADGDGQHSADDCARMATALAKVENNVFIGVRDLSFGKVPFRSWIGNRWTSLIFAILFRRWFPDTQTGLRAFPMALLPLQMSVSGDHYEYETGMLMAMVRNGIELEFLPIRTIYENENKSSHFRPIKDTLRIYGLILADLIRQIRA